MVNFKVLDMATIDFSQPDYFYYGSRSNLQDTFIIRNDKYGIRVAIQPGPIRLTSFGIPNINDTYCKDDTRRGYMRIPLDLNQGSCIEFRNFLSKADDYFASIEFRKKIFGNEYDKYEYQPMIKVPTEDDNDDCKSKRHQHIPKVENVNVKFMMTYDKNGIKTGETTTIIKYNNKVLPIKTITDVKDHVKFNSTINPTIIIHKIWACKAACLNYIPYGVGLVVSEINIGQVFDNYVDLSNPIYDLDGLKSAYKPFIDEKRIIINKDHTIIEV